MTPFSTDLYYFKKLWRTCRESTSFLRFLPSQAVALREGYFKKLTSLFKKSVLIGVISGSTLSLSAQQEKLAINQGQLKYMVFESYLHFQTHLQAMGGVSAEIEQIVKSGWFADLTYDHQPATIGQLKYMAKPFYDSLNSAQIGYSTFGQVDATSYYPWENSSNDDPVHQAVINLGQLNYVFNFDFITGYDSDGDSIPDWLENYLIALSASDEFTTLDDFTAFGDFDQDGADNLTEFLEGSLLDVRDSLVFYGDVVYLNNAIGSDTLDGRSARVVNNSGPKATYQAAQQTIQNQEVIIAFPGDRCYTQDIIDPDQKKVTLRPVGSVRLRGK